MSETRGTYFTWSSPPKLTIVSYMKRLGSHLKALKSTNSIWMHLYNSNSQQISIFAEKSYTSTTPSGSVWWEWFIQQTGSGRTAVYLGWLGKQRGRRTQKSRKREGRDRRQAVGGWGSSKHSFTADIPADRCRDRSPIMIWTWWREWCSLGPSSIMRGMLWGHLSQQKLQAE